MSLSTTLLRLSLIAGIITAFTSVAWTAEEQHRHDKHSAAKPTLNNGKLWQTDAPLRKGMDGIRHSMDVALPRIHADDFSGEQYLTLAKNVQDYIEFMVKNCKLPPDIDAQVHLVLEQIIAGVSTMEGKNGQSSGAVMIVQALNTYGQHFDHPGWPSLSH